MALNPRRLGSSIPGPLPPITDVGYGAQITVFEFTPDRIEERRIASIHDWQPPADDAVITWINVDDIRDPQVVHRFGERFAIHPLVLEDIHNTRQRPKLDDYEDYLFVVLKMLTWNDRARAIQAEQVSLIVMPRLVLSFQERTPNDVFEPVREALRQKRGRIRHEGADYVAYSLIDAIVDHYFVVIERLGEEIDRLEDQIVEESSNDVMRKLQELKRELAFLRNSVWPLRDVVIRLERAESPFIQRQTSIYLRDVYDHTVQVIETVETYRDIAGGMLDIYLSSINNRLNNVMKVLTIISTIFIPLTFISSVYGMNFDHMPELGWTFGYPLVLLVMLALIGAMLYVFRRERWL